MRLLIVCLAVTSVAAMELQHTYDFDPCRGVDCRAGRECVAVGDGPQCLCATSCPDHFTPVCGTDGKSYDNHCLLHRNACLKDYPISIHHKGFCKSDLKTSKSSYKKKYRSGYMEKNYLAEYKEKKYKAKYTKNDPISNDIFDDEEIKIEKSLLKKPIKTKSSRDDEPAVCYSSQRDTLRDLLIQHWEFTLKSQPWHVEGMTYRESLWGRFFSCDGDKNNYLTPDELFACTNDTFLFARPEQDDNLTKALCIDAMVDDGDKNQDWRLDFEEFTHVMDPLYHPKPKECSLEGKKYKDGNEVNVDCNNCVCAVGNWVCTSKDCPGSDKVNEQFSVKPFTTEDDYDDDDDDYDEDDYDYVEEDDFIDDDDEDDDNEDDDDEDDDDEFPLEYSDEDVDDLINKQQKVNEKKTKKDTKMGKKKFSKYDKIKKDEEDDFLRKTRKINEKKTKKNTKMDKTMSSKVDKIKNDDEDDDYDYDDEFDDIDYYEDDPTLAEAIKSDKPLVPIFIEYLLDRALRRKKDHLKEDTWDTYAFNEQINALDNLDQDEKHTTKDNNHENSLWGDLDDPPKTHLRRFLHDNLL